MIVLDRLLDIKNRHAKVLQEMLLDVMRALASPNMDIRKKTLDFAMDLVSPRNIDEVISVLKKEINRTQSIEEDQGGEYRQILIQAIHGCAVRFPAVASNVVHVLMDFLGDSNTASALDVITFVRFVYSLLSFTFMQPEVVNAFRLSK
jgi:coatomer subunit beta